MTSVIPLIVTGVILAVTGQTCLKSGMNRIGRIPALASREFAVLPLRLLREPFMLVGFPLYFLAAMVWVVVLSQAPLSFAYPFLGLNYVLVTLVSRLVLKEEVNWMKWAGVSLILAGIIVVGNSA